MSAILDMAGALLPCPLCRHTSWGQPQTGTALRRCSSCGIWLNGRSSSRQEEELRYDGCESVPVQDQAPIANYYWDWVQQVAGGETGCPRSVLDIGCGTGEFLDAARSAGARVAGMELDPVQAELCRQRGIETTLGSIFDVQLPNGPWQVITFWDVLDHLEEPQTALRLAVEALEPGGLVIVRGRNALLHVPTKVAIRRAQAVASRLRIPDVSVVHRWGIPPLAWCRLLTASGLENVRLYPGLPTPGDRYRSLGSRHLAGAVKATIRWGSMALNACTGQRLYLFPTVFAVAQKAR